jgi:hypothetical protein
MNLTTKSLAELLRSLRSNQSTDDNRRKSPRVGLRLRADIWHLSHGRMTVWLRDLSIGGANLAVPIPMLIGDELQILLKMRENGEREKISCGVRHCRQLAPGMYSVGVQFSTPLDQIA